MPKLDDSTLLARIAAFAEKPTPAGAAALAQTGDERALPALVQAMTDTMEGTDVVRYRQAVREVGTTDVLARWLTGDLDARRVAAHALTAHDPEHAPLIGLGLQDPDDQVRAIARRSLRARGPPALRCTTSSSPPSPRRPARAPARRRGPRQARRPGPTSPQLNVALEAETDDATRDRIAWALEKLEDDATA
jgi:hypothetical protein